MRHDSYLRLALKIAGKEIKYQHNLGAVITRGGAVISKATNIYENGAHAEARAIAKARSNGSELTGSIIYVARYMRSREFGMAKPCEHCQNLIKRCGIKLVVYTDNFGNFGTYKP